MRVLGVDPGYDRLGVAVLEKKDGEDVLVHSNCITTNKTSSFEDRLFELGEALTKLLSTYTPECVALETLYFNKNQKTAMAVAEMRGIVQFLARTHRCSVYEYTPQQIKVAVTGYGKSDKEQVAFMVKKLLPGVPERGHDDEYDAIAVGLTALASVRSLST